MSMILAAALLAAPAAQTPAPGPQATAAEAIDPARLAAAKATLEVLMPPERRAAMFDATMAPLMASVSQAMADAPSMKEALGKNPKSAQAFRRFMDVHQQRTTTRLKAALPGMFAAMERAYARRFTVAQLGEIAAFFRTPTGRAYMDQGMTIMSDPDVLAWQRELMRSSMATVMEDAKSFAADIEAGAGK